MITGCFSVATNINWFHNIQEKNILCVVWSRWSGECILFSFTLYKAWCGKRVYFPRKGTQSTFWLYFVVSKFIPLSTFLKCTIKNSIWGPAQSALDRISKKQSALVTYISSFPDFDKWQRSINSSHSFSGVDLQSNIFQIHLRIVAWQSWAISFDRFPQFAARCPHMWWGKENYSNR